MLMVQSHNQETTPYSGLQFIKLFREAKFWPLKCCDILSVLFCAPDMWARHHVASGIGAPWVKKLKYWLGILS